MRTLKNLAIFAAGGMTMLYTLAWAFGYRTEHPLEGAVVYEDDDIKVTRCNSNQNGISLATIVYKHD